MTWGKVRLKFISQIEYGSALPSDGGPEDKFLVYGSNGPYSKYVKSNTLSPVIVIGRKGSYGKINWSESPVFASDTTFFIDGSITDQNLRWLYYALQILHLDKGTKEAAVPGLSRSTIFQKALPLPSLIEQKAIAHFLDTKTAHIDSLIFKKRHLLKLVSEKRSALITKAVTKGLRSDASLKNSGFDWMGKVPVHWKVRKITHLFERIGSGTTPDTSEPLYYENGTTLWVTTSELRESLISDTKQKVTKLALDEISSLKIFSPGAIVIAMYGATIGRLGILDKEATVNQACCVFEKPLDILPKFFYYWLLLFRPKLIADSTGGGQPNLSQDLLRQIRLALPPIDEQAAIVEKLDIETKRIQALEDKLNDAISNLNEYRSALITAAVTGKIDVRAKVSQPEELEAL